MLSNLLIMRFLVLNALAFSAVAALTFKGLVVPLFANDASYITYGITGLFVLAWCWTFKEILVASLSLNDNATYGARTAAMADADKDLGKIAWLNDVSEYLVGLGLLGTVIGFYMALPEGMSLDAKGAQTAIAGLMSGMKTALTTTIIGAVLAFWHQVNMRMLQTALNTYWSDRLLAEPDWKRD